MLTGDPEIATRIAQYEMAFKMQASVPDLMDVSAEGAAESLIHVAIGRTSDASAMAKIELDIRDSEPDWGPFAAPTAPPDARVSADAMVSSVDVCVRTTWLSGSYFSWVRVVASVSISADTRTTALPGPITAASSVSTFREK